MNDDNMCTRHEVHEEIREALGDFKETMREERDKRMEEVAERVHRDENDKTLRWIGIGGILAVVSFIYFYGGQTRDIEHMHEEMQQIQQSVSELEDFMNRGDRFTVSDGTELKDYSDQQDQVLQSQIDRNHEEMKEWKDDIIDEIRNINK